MGKLKWIVLAIAMAGIGGFACGSDDDKGGGGGAGGKNKGGGPCATDPNGQACMACGMAILGCLGDGVCENAFGALMSCTMQNCGDADEDCTACESESAAYATCMMRDCVDAKDCF